MKLLIAGAGFIVSDFLPITKDLPKTDIVGITGTPNDLDQMKEYQNKYHIEECFTDYDQALKETAADTAYVAVPNFLHYAFTKKALEAGKNVICEKPFTVKYDEFRKLKNLAEEKKLILVEAITNQYLTNYKVLKDHLSDLGQIKIVSMNYSQYSHRYDAFKQGKILPVFDPKKGGGALMDLNIYNIHFIVGLLGMPKSVEYKANIERGIDTSGVLNLDYGNFKAVLIAAKDCAAPVNLLIEGDEGTIQVDGPANVMDSFDIFKDQDKTHIDEKVYPHRMYEEFRAFEKMIDDHDLVKDKEALDHSDQVMQVVQKAIDSAGLKLEQVRKMKFNSLMHVNIIAKDWDKMVDFYQNKLGFKNLVLVKYGEYLNRPDRPEQQKIAQKHPERIMYGYFEICSGQFIEMFPKSEAQNDDVEWNDRTGLNHFALTVNDIDKTFKEFKEKGLPLMSDKPTKGPSETWQFWSHDPDGNYFEVMQFTDKSYQINGHIDK